VHAVQPLADLGPRAALVDLPSDLVRFIREQVVLLAPALAKLACTKGEKLLFAQQRRVELLADRVIAGRARLVAPKKFREVLEGPGCGGTGFGVRTLVELARTFKAPKRA